MADHSSNTKADLHTHTNYSDGVFTPEQLLNKAHAAGLTYLAVTDHDNVDAIDEAIAIGETMNIEIVPGVELSSDHNGREVHVLGYFFDHKDPSLLDWLIHFREERLKRAEKIVARLNDIGIKIAIDDVFAQVKGNASIGRPHIAVALLEKGYIDTYIEAFIRYLGDGKPAYVKKPNLTTKEAVELISKCGGLSFLAHPGKNIRDNDLISIIEYGIDGIEVVHPSHSQGDTLYFQNTAGQYFLLESGGSDFHGGRINDESVIGRFYVTGEKVNAMKNRLFKK